MIPASSRIDDYESISVNGRLVGALLAVGQLLDERGINSRQADDLLDHLWKWLTVDENSFDDWEAWTSELLEFALGGDLPREVEREFESLGLPTPALRRLWERLVDIVYFNLFTAVDHGNNMRDLRALSDSLANYGISLPPVELLQSSPAVARSLASDWGAVVVPDEVVRLRALAW